MFLSRLTPELLIANLLVLLVGMTVHEFAHSYVAHRMGDPVPSTMGRLTLNPLVHINWFGWLMYAVIGFGTLGAAPVSLDWKIHRWGYLAAVAAGPISNLILAVLFVIPLRFLNEYDFLRALMVTSAGRISSVSDFILLVLVQSVYLNISLFIFNLIPLYPLDGWRMMMSFVAPDLARTLETYQQSSQYIFYGLIGLTILSGYFAFIPDVLNFIVGEPISRLFFELLYAGYR